MSGFEIAGVVLGAIPLIISALEHYKAGQGSLAAILKHRGQLDILLDRLRDQRTSFYFDILQLLRDAEIEEVEDRTDITEGDCLLILQNEKGGTQLQMWAPKDDLNALLIANPPTRGRNFEFKERISFSIERGALAALIEALREDRLSLKTIIKGMKTEREYTSKLPSRESSKLSATLTQVSAYARSLFTAICQTCTCSCQNNHKVLLELQARIPATGATKRPTRSKKPSMTFKLVFDLKGHFKEAYIRANPDNATENMVSQRTSRRVRFQDSNIPGARNPSAKKALGICDLVGLNKVDGCILSLSLAGESLHPIWEKPTLQRKLLSPISLEEILQQGAADENLRITPRQRTLLALDVASSIIQLQQTCWSNPPFSSKVVKLLVQDSRKDPCGPFIEQVTEPNRASSPHPDPQAALLDLSILLLEVWHHKTLEIWATEAAFGVTDTPERRHMAAIRWLQSTSDLIPTHHLRAIEQCLGLYSGRLRYWDDDEFLRMYCENVILPLLKSCEAWL
ncbi:hypothetical protein O1611_g747 [Lasiodiplodia mahajangana]|uniref:Uncharacterized protein n=1 Tax=Lasiodiplodia mahajangana TaxID=1108764 RepID=A0ACC2JZN7_9PEZI|nr:hypothetical protein O1611_g747 [Lasiodiplodia mahajangana]